ncbi:MAG: energy transducer TonB [Adhaeribacter sp.]|nr:energy transducer TonB [Adhaeribacter sp.]
MQNLRYPAAALRYGEEGIVVVEVIIDETGKLGSSEVVKKVSSSLDREALRVVRAMPDFKPAMEEGVARGYVHSLPLRFGVER